MTERRCADLTKLGFSMDEIHRFVVPRRTLARRIAKGEPLTVAENDSALRLVRVMELADRRLQAMQRKPGAGCG